MVATCSSLSDMSFLNFCTPTLRSMCHGGIWRVSTRGLDRACPRPRVLEGDERHRGDRPRLVARLALGLEDRRDVLREGHRRGRCLGGLCEGRVEAASRPAAASAASPSRSVDPPIVNSLETRRRSGRREKIPRSIRPVPVVVPSGQRNVCRDPARLFGRNLPGWRAGREGSGETSAAAGAGGERDSQSSCGRLADRVIQPLSALKRPLSSSHTKPAGCA